MDATTTPATPELAEFPSAGPAPANAGAAANGSGLGLLYDLELPVWIELGRTRMTVQDVLALGRGSVIQLERLVGEPVDVFVGDRCFAQGEVVVVGEQFAVRVTRVLTAATPDERGA